MPAHLAHRLFPQIGQRLLRPKRPSRKTQNSLPFFRALLVRKPRKTKAQTRRNQRRRERILRHFNGAPRRRTQKQNSPSEPGRPDPGVQPTTAKTTKTLPATNCRLRRKSQPQRRNQLPTSVAQNAQGDSSQASYRMPILRFSRRNNLSSPQRTPATFNNARTYELCRQNAPTRQKDERRHAVAHVSGTSIPSNANSTPAGNSALVVA